jgi:hypothetical protein
MVENQLQVIFLGKKLAIDDCLRLSIPVEDDEIVEETDEHEIVVEANGMVVKGNNEVFEGNETTSLTSIVSSVS